MAQAQPTSSSARRQNLVCAVCREVYRSPRLLPQCHHSFCLQCLLGMARTHGSFFPCPTCRTAVRVPEGGVGCFKVNFYIPEEDLERERNQAFKPVCGTHSMEELIFFCQQCDQAICLRCKLTKHDHHPTEDLADTAKRCKKLLKSSRKRLKKSVEKLAKASELSLDNQRKAKEKADFLKAQINEQCDSLVAMVTGERDQALRDLDALTRAMDDDLSTHVSGAQRHLDSLIQLQQQVSHAIGSDNDAEVVAVEREVSQGEGSVEELERMEERSVSSNTQRPGLQWDAPVLRQRDVAMLFGSPVCLQLPSVAPRETVTRLYKCDEVHGCQRVKAISCPVFDYMIVKCGGRAPDCHLEVDIKINLNTGKVVEPGQLVEKNDKACRLIRGKHGRHGSFSLQNHPPTIMITSLGGNEREFHLEDASTPIAFDEVCGRLIVLSEDSPPPTPTHEDQNTRDIKPPSLAAVHVPSKTRTVRLYIPEESEPVSRYTPPQQPFFPTDVCFGVRGIVLISDLATDTVHVVSLDNNQLQFLRYLANGSPHILRPTALSCYRGSVYVGCENGWVLRSDPISGAEPDGREDMETDEDEEEEVEEGSSHGTSDQLQMENWSESAVNMEAC